MLAWIQAGLLVAMTATGAIWLQVHGNDDTVSVPVDSFTEACDGAARTIAGAARQIEILELEVRRNAVVARMEATNLALEFIHDSELRMARLVALERMQDELDVTQARLVELGYQGWYKMHSVRVDY